MILNISYHIYECTDCIVNFGVEQAFEDQSEVKCPVCLSDDHLIDVGSGVVYFAKDEEEEE